MNGYDTNIIVTKGEAIPFPDDVIEYSYTHRRVSFDKIDVLEAIERPDDNSAEAMQKIFDGRNAFIYIDPIGVDISAGVNALGARVISNAKEAEQYAVMPCGVKTKDGSIIPHPVLPDAGFSCADNGLTFNGSTRDLPLNGGYLWSAADISDNVPFPATSGASAYAADPKCYGRHADVMRVENCATRGDTDVPIILDRHYMCDIKAMDSDVTTPQEPESDTSGYASAGNGSFAICYFIDEKEIILAETSDAAGSTGLTQPFLKFIAGARVDLDSAYELDLETGQYVENVSRQVSVTIQAHDGDAEVRVGIDAKHASFSQKDNDIMPPQCVRDNNGKPTMNAIYLYPTYYGLAATNSITEIGQEKNEGFVVKDSFNGVASPWNKVTICGPEGPTIYQEYAREYLRRHPGSDLEFFPTMLHETADPASIKIRVDTAGRIRFGSVIEAIWSKCLGKWAYCPMYFHRCLSFTMYFKGAYFNGEDGVDDFTYYLYPVVGVDKGTSHGEWSGIDENGADCVVARRVCTDHSRLESIYRADFRFASEKMLRYPIEVFGVELVLVRREFQFTHKSGNGKFMLCGVETDGTHDAEGGGGDAGQVSPGIEEGEDAMIREQYTRARLEQGVEDLHLGLMTSLNVTTNLDGPTGSMELDGYPIQQGIAVLQQTQSVGELDFAVHFIGKPGEDDDIGLLEPANNPCPSIFSGYGLEIATAGSEGDYRISVRLEGVQRKMSDMKLVCAPFWDGDRLEAICLYFEQYMKLRLRMIDHTVARFEDAKPVDTNMFAHSGNWVSEDAYTLNGSQIGVNDNAFRVPRSFNWMNPSVNFQTGTTCLEALKRLAELTACVFCVGYDGVGYFYELNEYGFPYYVQNQIDNGYYVEFYPQDIVSINLSPNFDNWYNSIATFGFIRKNTRDAAIEDSVSQDGVLPGVNYTMTDSTLFPWSRHNVGVENGFLTKGQLKKIHDTRVRFSRAWRYTGTVSVIGNTRVTHLYQVVKIMDKFYYVMQISHNVDLSRKQWTTSYQIGYFEPGDATGVDKKYSG